MAHELEQRRERKWNVQASTVLQGADGRSDWCAAAGGEEKWARIRDRF